MTVKAILDTGILSEYLKGHNVAVTSRAADYARDHGVFTVSRNPERKRSINKTATEAEVAVFIIETHK